MQVYSIHKFAKLVGVTPQTLRNWDRTGRLKPHHTGSNGYRYYTGQELNQVLGVKDDGKKTVGYCRVSSAKQADELVEYMAFLNDCEVDVLDSNEKTAQEELVEDLVQIVTVFSCRLQGKRAGKAKKLVAELIGGEHSD